MSKASREKIRAMIRGQVERRLANRGQLTEFPEEFEVAEVARALKYITKDGRVRVDMEFDTFKQLFETALWNYFLLEIQTSDDSLMQQTPERVRMALNLYRCDYETMQLCEMVRLVRPMFDYRENPR